LLHQRGAFLFICWLVGRSWLSVSGPVVCPFMMFLVPGANYQNTWHIFYLPSHLAFQSYVPLNIALECLSKYNVTSCLAHYCSFLCNRHKISHMLFVVCVDTQCTFLCPLNKILEAAQLGNKNQLLSIFNVRIIFSKLRMSTLLWDCNKTIHR